MSEATRNGRERSHHSMAGLLRSGFFRSHLSMSMRAIATVLILIAGMYATSAGAQTADARWAEHGRNHKYLIAIDRESVRRTPDTVQVRALSVFAEPVPLDDGVMTHLFAQLTFSCPPATVILEYEWHHADDGTLIEEGEISDAPEPIGGHQTIYSGMAADLCSGRLGHDGKGEWNDADDARAAYQTYLAQGS